MSVTSFVLIITSCFLFLIPTTFSLSFNISTISLSFNLSTIGTYDAGHTINVTGDAYISNKGIQVTPDERNMALGGKTGRATYNQPLHLWDKASGNLADFSTHFSFVIDSSGNSSYADGLAFFLAPLGSSLRNWTGGGNLGLGNSTSQVTPSSEYSFVAVEFDTFSNNMWDPAPYGPHVGIDINSIASVATAEWDTNITAGVQNDAWISYSSSSKMLSVDFTGYSSKRIQQGKLSYLVDLRDYLPEFVTFGFSAATGDLFETNNIKSWDFNSSLQINVAPTPSPGLETEPAPSPVLEPVTNSITPGEGKGNKNGLVVGLSIGQSILILASAFAVYILWKKKYKKGPAGDRDFFDSSMDNEFEKGTGPKKFSYRELVFATNNFAEQEKLAEGGFGGVYRGLLRETNTCIAVKRVSSGSKQGAKEYASEVKIISQLRHRNLVRLLGWCHERGELLLVYEFMPNGSLDSHLFREKPVLAWKVRHKIAQGLASALLYLHEEWERCVVHRDIKASNIMLDSNFNAKLGDFGLARLVDHEKGSQTTILAGTMGYLAPECAITGSANKESDIYSFGIALLEIACGRRPIDRSRPGNQVILVEWVWRLYGVGQLLDAADPKLESEYDAREIEEVMVVGLWCVHPYSNQRPTIRQAIKVLSSEAALPTLPPVMPVATYNTLTVPGSSDEHSGAVLSTDSNLSTSTGSTTASTPKS